MPKKGGSATKVELMFLFYLLVLMLVILGYLGYSVYKTKQDEPKKGLAPKQT